MDSFPHKVYVNGVLTHQFQESIWYDTASPAQACIARLREIQDAIPNVRVVSFGQSYMIATKEEFVSWVRDVFSPNGTSYKCDFSEYL